MAVICELLVMVIRAVLPVLFEKMPDTMEDAAPQSHLRQRLQKKIRKAWIVAPVVVCLLVLPGCFSRTVYVPDGEPVRLRKDIKKTKVWVMGKDGKPVSGTITLKEGWYSMPLGKETAEDK